MQVCMRTPHHKLFPYREQRTPLLTSSDGKGGQERWPVGTLSVSTLPNSC